MRKSAHYTVFHTERETQPNLRIETIGIPIQNHIHATSTCGCNHRVLITQINPYNAHCFLPLSSTPFILDDINQLFLSCVFWLVLSTEISFILCAMTNRSHTHKTKNATCQSPLDTVRVSHPPRLTKSDIDDVRWPSISLYVFTVSATEKNREREAEFCPRLSTLL